MSETPKYRYESVFSVYIEGLVRQKKSSGFIYDYEAYILKKFDEFCIDRGYTEALITREVSMQWAVKKDTEGVNYRNQRVSFLRQLSLYMNSMGIKCYIPRQHPSTATPIPHIPDADELRELFEVIDTECGDKKRSSVFSIEYPVLFRLYYCCGLRLSEGLNLKRNDVDLDNGVLTVRQSKGNKDRLVYMADDVAVLCKNYDEAISRHYPCRVWFFPGRKDSKPLHKSGICHKFRQYWEMTGNSQKCEKRPTIHALRHAFVVDRMNAWMAEGVPMDAMMPYLSRYLGHSGIKDTMYYYHQVKSAFKIVREKDSISDQIIPEVTIYEG